MRVKNLVSWAGHHFSYLPGEEIDLSDEVAQARIAAGLAALPDGAATTAESEQRRDRKPRRLPSL